MDGRQSGSGPSTTTTTSSPGVVEHHAVGVKAALFALVPILFVLILVCVVLFVFVYFAVRKRVKKQTRYQPVATKQPEDETRRVTTLPYPPTVKISKSSYPHLEYSLATQLPQPMEIPTTRYPFIQHQLPGPQGPLIENRPPRLRTRRKGNHKHIKGKHIILGREKTVDSDSPTPEPEPGNGTKLCPIPVRKELRDSSTPEERSEAAGLESSSTSRPEITLVFKYDEVNATLAVTIERVVNLPLKEDGTEMDGYVRLHFTPALSAGSDVGSTTRTQTRRKSSSPVFHEELTYSNIKKDELLTLTLHVEVVRYKSYGKHNILVQTEIEMRNVKFFDGNCRLTLPLEPPKVKKKKTC